MDRTTTIKLIKHVEVTLLGDEKAMVDFETGKYYLLKGPANDIWDMIQTDITVGTVVDNLRKIYDVDAKECESSVIEFVDQLVKSGFVILD